MARNSAVAGCWLALLLCGSGCGTVLYDNEIDVGLADPGGRLGAPPYEVSVFDHRMGSSLDWARRTAGRVEPGARYEGKLSSQSARFFFDASLPEELWFGLAIPAYRADGYFLVHAEPVNRREAQSTAPFVSWGDDGPPPGSVAPVQVRCGAQARKKGWHLALDVTVPAAK